VNDLEEFVVFDMEESERKFHLGHLIEALPDELGARIEETVHH